MARMFERQVMELHVACRVTLLNRFSQLGCPTTALVSAMASLCLKKPTPHDDGCYMKCPQAYSWPSVKVSS
jgi:hypothetical protein